MPEWQGLVVATAPKYLKGASDLTIRERLLLTMLQKRGRISYGESSHICYWNVLYDEPPIESYGDAGLLTFNNHDLYKQLNHDWRGYVGTDKMTEKQRLMNRSYVAIINLYDQKTKNLLSAIRNHFGGELYIDGNAAGNENRIHGFESFTGAGTTVTADRVAQPSDTYGGQSTALGAVGTWDTNLSTPPNAAVATDWPMGSGDAKYDWNSPKLLNWSSSNWGTGSVTWQSNCDRVLRYMVLALTRTGGRAGRPTLHEMSTNLFYEYQNKVQARERIIVPHKEADDLGFGDTMNQDGVMVKHEFEVPENTFYTFNVNQMELACLYDQLFMPKGPFWDPREMAYLFSVGFFGNCRYNVKHFGKGAAYA